MTIVSIAASVSAMTFAGPRVYYAMARDGAFFAAAARVHPRYRTPAISIVAQGAWSAVLVLTGSFAQLIEYTGFAVVLFSGIAGVALFVLRRRAADEPRPFKAWGYPYVPALFVGHPLVELAEAAVAGRTREQLRGELGLDPQAPTVALLPGSRRNELERLVPVIARALVALQDAGRAEMQWCRLGQGACEMLKRAACPSLVVVNRGR